MRVRGSRGLSYSFRVWGFVQWSVATYWRWMNTAMCKAEWFGNGIQGEFNWGDPRWGVWVNIKGAPGENPFREYIHWSIYTLYTVNILSFYVSLYLYRVGGKVCQRQVQGAVRGTGSLVDGKDPIAIGFRHIGVK